MLTKEQSLRRNKNIISSLLLLLVPLGGFLVYKDLNKTPTFYEGGTLTNYERTLKLDKQYSYEEGEVKDIPDTEYLGYFTFLKDGFNAHTISLTSEDKPKSIHKHVHFDTERDSVTNTFTTDGIVIDTNYKTVETKTKTLGAPTPNIKQTFILRNTTDETKETNFTSTTRLNTNTVKYNGRTITITDAPTILKAEEKTASIPEFASDIGYENPETEQFENYTHTYRTPAFLTFETPEGTAVYDWRDAQHLNHTVTLYEHDNNFYLSFTVSDITIDPQSSFTIDPSYGLDNSDNYDVRLDGQMGIDTLTNGGIVIADINGDTISDLILGASASHYNGGNSGSVFVTFGTTTIATGTLPQNVSTNYNVRYDGDAVASYLAWEGSFTAGDVNGDGFPDLVLGAEGADNNGGNSGSAWVIFSTLIDDVGFTTGNTKSLSTPANYNIRFDGAASSDQLTDNVALTTGDVNGDGLGDLILGTPYADNGGSTSGSAWVIFSTLIDDVGITTGNNLALSTSTNYNIRYDGTDEWGYLTDRGALTVGDVNGDGFGDLVLGAHSANNNGAGSGSVWVLFSTLIDDVGATTGNDHSLATSTNYSIRYDGAAGDYLGYDGALVAGDVNGDSLGDLVIGTYYSDNNGSNTGSAWVMFSTLIDDYGTTTGNNLALSTSTNYNIRYDGAANSDNMTLSGAIATGDINGDGFGDLVLGAWYADNNGNGSGSAWVMFSTLIDDVGATTGNIKWLATTTNYNIRYDGGAAGDSLSSAFTIGDINGDGLGDLVLGAPNADNNGSGSGSTWVMFSTLIDDVGTTTGNSKPLNTGTNYNARYDGGAAGDNLTTGSALTDALAVGDINGDGLGDLVLGASDASNNGALSGSAWAMFSTLIDDVGTTTNNAKTLSTSTDYSARYDGGENGVQGLTENDTIAVGDINGDGVPDLVLGAPNTSYSDIESGATFIVFGPITSGTRNLHTSSNYNIRYDGPVGDTVRLSSGGVHIGDINGDGLDDLVIGTSRGSHNGYTSGSAWVMFSTLIDDVGTTTGNTKSVDVATNYNIRYDGGNSYDYMTSYNAVEIGDVNGDGYDDLMLGASGADNNGGSSGSVWVMFSTLIDDVGVTTGNNKPLDVGTNYNVRYDGVASQAFAREGILASDINGDMLGDLVLGAYLADNNAADAGSAWIMFSTLIDDVGATTGNNKPLDVGTNYNVRYDGGVSADYLARDGAIAAGDLNNDGYGDLVLGGSYADYNGADSGSAWVMFSTLVDDVGTTTGNNLALSTSTNYNIRYDGGAASDRLTNYRALAVGDVNGDDSGDLVLGGSTAGNNGANSGSAWVMFSTLIDDVGTTTGNNLALSTSTNYNIRYDGGASDTLTNGGVLAIGDVNGDGVNDLLLGSYFADYTDLNSGSFWVMHSDLIDDVGVTTGNNKALSTSTNYSIRYDGGAEGDTLGNSGIVIGDMNNDGRTDIVTGSHQASNNGYWSGSAWMIFAPPPPKYRMNGSIEFTGSVQFK